MMVTFSTCCLVLEQVFICIEIKAEELLFVVFQGKCTVLGGDIER